MRRTVADRFANTLVAAGVERVYGIVGDSLNGLGDATGRQVKIVAAFTADALGQVDLVVSNAGDPISAEDAYRYGMPAKLRRRWAFGDTASRRLASSRNLSRPGSRSPDPRCCVKVKPMQLVMPPSPLVSPEAVVGMAVCSARAMLHGKGHDVWERLVENIP
jgi:pyruvate dehydrogenase (quinone)